MVVLSILAVRLLLVSSSNPILSGRVPGWMGDGVSNLGMTEVVFCARADLSGEECGRLGFHLPFL